MSGIGKPGIFIRRIAKKSFAEIRILIVSGFFMILRVIGALFHGFGGPGDGLRIDFGGPSWWVANGYWRTLVT